MAGLLRSFRLAVHGVNDNVVPARCVNTLSLQPRSPGSTADANQPTEDAVCNADTLARRATLISAPRDVQFLLGTLEAGLSMSGIKASRPIDFTSFADEEVICERERRGDDNANRLCSRLVRKRGLGDIRGKHASRKLCSIIEISLAPVMVLSCIYTHVFIYCSLLSIFNL